jgi:hypothetical protein
LTCGFDQGIVLDAGWGENAARTSSKQKKAGSFALADFMRIMLKNAVAAPREQRLKNEVRKNAVKCRIAAVSCNSTVAPHTGAWIETGKSYYIVEWLASPLTQGRGLKR